MGRSMPCAGCRRWSGEEACIPTPEQNKQTMRTFASEVFGNKNLDYTNQWLAAPSSRRCSRSAAHGCQDKSSSCPLPGVVSRATRVPSACITYRLGGPARLLPNAILVPSGDQAG